jgi:hypothetical protein
MVNNLYELLRLSNELPPQRQLDSGEVEWTEKVPVGGSKNVDIYRGRYLKREDVTIKVIRSVKKDEESINVCCRCSHPGLVTDPIHRELGGKLSCGPKCTIWIREDILYRFTVSALQTALGCEFSLLPLSLRDVSTICTAPSLVPG